MPKRLDLREGDVFEVNGCPVVVVYARGGRPILGVAGCDSDGLLEEPADLRRWASRLRAKIDNPKEIRDY